MDLGPSPQPRLSFASKEENKIGGFNRLLAARKTMLIKKPAGNHGQLDIVSEGMDEDSSVGRGSSLFAKRRFESKLRKTKASGGEL